MLLFGGAGRRSVLLSEKNIKKHPRWFRNAVASRNQRMLFLKEDLVRATMRNWITFGAMKK